MYETIKVAVQQYDKFLVVSKCITVVLGGSFTDGDCPSGGTTYCPYCWDNGQRNCGVGASNQFGLAKKRNTAAYIRTKGPNGWRGSKATADSEISYVCYSTTWNARDPCNILAKDVVACVSSNKWTLPIENVTSVTGSSSTPETDLNNISVTSIANECLWWIALVVLAAVLLIATFIVCVVFRCCCGARDLVEVEYKSEDDDGFFCARDTRSNRSLVNGCDRIRSMGRQRSSSYSASQCYSQNDMEDCPLSDDECVSQRRSVASYYC